MVSGRFGNTGRQKQGTNPPVLVFESLKAEEESERERERGKIEISIPTRFVFQRDLFWGA